MSAVEVQTPVPELDTLSADEILTAAAAPAGVRLGDGARHLLEARGKQLRASLVLEASKYGGRRDERLARRAAAAVEIFHSATLAHDDVVDESELRRGRQTVQARFGTRGAGLTALWLFGRSLDLMAECGEEPTAVLAETACLGTDGQMRDTESRWDDERTVEQYDETVGGKTAALFWLPARVGAMVGGAQEATVEGLSAYAWGIGMAFQITDDVLDLIATHQATGKTRGLDLSRGVYTLPLVYALRDRPQLAARLERLTDADLQGVVQEIREAGGFRLAMRDAEAHVERAKRALEGLPDEDPVARARLLQLADYTYDRVPAPYRS